MKFEQIKDNKETYIKFRVTNQQKEIVKEMCRLKNVTISEYILSLIFEDIKKNMYVE